MEVKTRPAFGLWSASSKVGQKSFFSTSIKATKHKFMLCSDKNILYLDWKREERDYSMIITLCRYICLNWDLKFVSEWIPLLKQFGNHMHCEAFIFVLSSSFGQTFRQVIRWKLEAMVELSNGAVNYLIQGFYMNSLDPNVTIQINVRYFNDLCLFYFYLQK